MKLYLCYLTASIERWNDEAKLSEKIIKAVRDYAKLSADSPVIFLPCDKLPDDARLIIAGDVKGSVFTTQNKMLKDIQKKLFDAIQLDQGNPAPYNVDVRINSSFVPPQNVRQPAQESVKPSSGKSDDSELDYEKRAQNYAAVEPEYTFDRVILPPQVLDKIQEALNIFKYEKKVFREWGLRTIEPHPSSSLSFYGPSGTGKTMAAEAIASQLGKKILRVSYADIESKFHGEGPKMVKAIFYAAQRDGAVLFIDEADSLLSKRLTNVTSGSDQAINSMRSQLLISLERFEGIVIFATNLVVNYDQAFLTRLISVEFVLPDKDSRKKIWAVHVLPDKENRLNIPLAGDVDLDALAEKYEFCGREIKKAVISACLQAAMSERDSVCQEDFITACDRILLEENSLAQAKDHTVSGEKKLSPEQEAALKNAIKAKIKEDKKESNPPDA